MHVQMVLWLANSQFSLSSLLDFLSRELAWIDEPCIGMSACAYDQRVGSFASKPRVALSGQPFILHKDVTQFQCYPDSLANCD